MFIGTFHGFCLSLLLETEYLTGDGAGMHHLEQVDAAETAVTERKLLQAARSIERRDLPRLPMFCTTCEKCDHVDVCPTRHQRE